MPELDKNRSKEQPFGGAKLIQDGGDDFAIVYEGTALMAAKEGYDQLQAEGLHGKLVQVQVLKPFPDEALFDMIKQTKKIVTVENHSILGGLGGAVSEMLAAHASHPPLVRVGVHDEFTQSGPTAKIKDRYGLSGRHVAKAAKQ